MSIHFEKGANVQLHHPPNVSVQICCGSHVEITVWTNSMKRVSRWWQIQLFVKYSFCWCFSYIVCSDFSCGKMGSRGAAELGLFPFPPNTKLNVSMYQCRYHIYSFFQSLTSVCPTSCHIFKTLNTISTASVFCGHTIHTFHVVFTQYAVSEHISTMLTFS